MKKHLLALATLLMTCSLASTAEVEDWTVGTNTWPVEKTTQQICPGVTYTLVDWKVNRSTSYPGSHLHVVEVDLTNPKLSIENFKTPGKMTGNKTLINYAKDHHTATHQVVAGANANFWSTAAEGALYKSYGGAQPHGVCIADNIMYTDPNIATVPHCGGPITTTGLLAIDEKGQAYLDYLAPQTLRNFGTDENPIWATENGPGSGSEFSCFNKSIGHQMQLDMCNRFVAYHCASCFTPEYGRTRQFNIGDLGADFVNNVGAPGTTGGNDGYTEVLLDFAPGTTAMNIGGKTPMVVKEIRSYPAGTTAVIGNIGDHDLAVVGRFGFANVMTAAWRVGHEVDFNTKMNFKDQGSPEKVVHAISGNVLAMKDGVITPTVTTEAYNKSIYPRTTYGLNADRTKLYIITCEHAVKAPNRYYGFSLEQICIMARDHFGVSNLTQVDCGGSAQMYCNGEQVAASYDSGGQRAVYNGLFVCYNGDDITINKPGYNEPEPPADPDEGWTDSGKRAHYAYALTKVDDATVPTVAYKLSGAVNAVDIVLTNRADATDVVLIPGTTDAGDNQVQIVSSDLTPGAEYDWTVKVYSEAIPATSHFFHEQPGKLDARGGVGVVTDTESPAYGQIISSIGYGQGFNLYNPDMTKIGNYHAAFDQINPANRSDFYRLTMRGKNTAYACCFSDKGAGYWKFDPTDPTATPTNLIGGTNDGTGCFKVGDTVVGSGASGIGIQTEEDGTESIWVFAEDWPSGNYTGFKGILCRWMLDGDKQITWGLRAATEEWAGTGKFGNQNVCITPTPYGVFCAQHRGQGSNSIGCPGFVFINPSFTADYNSGEHTELFNSCAGSVAISDDLKLLAVSGYNENIKIFDVTWDADHKPSFKFRAYVNDSKHVTEVSQMAFDPAGNLYAWQRNTNGDYAGLFGYSWKNDAPEASTKAPTNSFLTIPATTGIDTIVTDIDDSQAVYYNVNGVRINSAALAPGLYIKVVGNTKTKIVIK